MQVDVEIPFPGQGEEPVQQIVQVVERPAMSPARGAGDAPQQPALRRHQVGQPRAMVAAIGIDRHQRHRLQRHAVGPGVAQGGEGGPGFLGLPLVAVQMRADRRHAMRLGAGEAEVHPPQQVVAAPVGHAAAARRLARAGMGAARIRRAAEDMALVQMCMGIRQHRPDLPPAQSDLPVHPQPAGGKDLGHRPVFQQQVDSGRAVGIDRGARGSAIRQQRRGHPQVAQAHPSPAGQAGESRDRVVRQIVHVVPFPSAGATDRAAVRRPGVARHGRLRHWVQTNAERSSPPISP